MSELALPLATINWGSVREWVGALAAAGGLIFAALEIRASRREREAEERRRMETEQENRLAMARAVSVSAYYDDVDDAEIGEAHPWAIEPRGLGNRSRDFTWFRMRYRLHNGGDYPIDNVVVIARNPGWRPGEDPQAAAACELVIGTLAAGAGEEGNHIVHFDVPPAFGELPVLAGVFFSDVWGQHWFRAPGTLDRRDDPPRVC